jgi:hypothetical protein
MSPKFAPACPQQLPLNRIFAHNIAWLVAS